MASVPMTEKEKVLTIKNVVAAIKDITKLNKRGYNFLNQSTGFIAHYNMYGFIDYYSNWPLVSDIMANAEMNQWGNFSKGDENYDYKMAKKDVYNRILEVL